MLYRMIFRLNFLETCRFLLLYPSIQIRDGVSDFFDDLLLFHDISPNTRNFI